MKITKKLLNHFAEKSERGTMKTIKAQICKCGENIFEDDTRCINCGKKVDKRKFKIEEIAEIHEERKERNDIYYNVQNLQKKV